MMHNIYRNIILTIVFMSFVVSAAPVKKKARFIEASQYTSSANQQLAQALKMAQSGQYQAAANALFNLSRKPELINEKPQIKYILGLMLMELKLNQVAAFQFVDVIRLNNPKYTKQAVEKLSIVADTLGDDTILNYAVTKVDIGDIPGGQRDMIYYRLGEVKLKSLEFAKAADLFARISPGSTYYLQALFNKGLAELEANQPTLAIATFQKIIDSRSKASVTDTNKVAAQMAIARSYYQKQDFEAAIQAYTKVPRDTTYWHDAIFEQSWAMLRSARFRSALSQFQTIHSQYYEDFYVPESLLLRAIVYLYICKYDEMEKVLNLYEKSYGPVRNKVNDFLKANKDPLNYFSEIEKAAIQKRNPDKTISVKVPYLVLREVLGEGDVKRSLAYLKKLSEEKLRIDENPSFKNSGLGQYALRVVNNRVKNSKAATGEMVKAHLQNIRVDLSDLNEQASFIKYEMINGQKEGVKKRIAGKGLAGTQIDDKVDRQFYIENGYQYYPFQGEFWLDELGNYHYLGQQSCE
ncbi:MAG: tetratricopeptide repeat protein [Pseudobdellovibrionaceae bacterium]